MDNEEECGVVSSFLTALLAMTSGVPEASLFSSTRTLNSEFSSPAPAVPSVQYLNVDSDGNGQVSPEELSLKIKQIMGDNIKEDTLKGLVTAVVKAGDTDGDGVLSAEEDNADVQFNVTRVGNEYEIDWKGQADSYDRIELGIIGGLSFILLIPAAIVARTYYDIKVIEKEITDIRVLLKNTKLTPKDRVDLKILLKILQDKLYTAPKKIKRNGSLVTKLRL